MDNEEKPNVFYIPEFCGDPAFPAFISRLTNYNSYNQLDTVFIVKHAKKELVFKVIEFLNSLEKEGE